MKPNLKIKLNFDDTIYSPEVISSELQSIKGPIDIYFWFEGQRGIPEAGANFYKENFFKPIVEVKQDAKFLLYSLIGWNFSVNVPDLKAQSKMSAQINKVNKLAVTAISAAGYLKYCTEDNIKENLKTFIADSILNVKYFYELSKDYKNKNKTVSEFFSVKSNLFDSIGSYDVSKAYSVMQYIEGFYLLQKSVKSKLDKGEKLIQVALVLPNDEAKYYRDYVDLYENMLKLEFGESLNEVDINIWFRFFSYGEKADDRPYSEKGPKLKSSSIQEFLNF